MPQRKVSKTMEVGGWGRVRTGNEPNPIWRVRGSLSEKRESRHRSSAVPKFTGPGKRERWLVILRIFPTHCHSSNPTHQTSPNMFIMVLSYFFFPLSPPTSDENFLDPSVRVNSVSKQVLTPGNDIISLCSHGQSVLPL